MAESPKTQQSLKHKTPRPAPPVSNQGVFSWPPACNFETMKHQLDDVASVIAFLASKRALDQGRPYSSRRRKRPLGT
jgi:hypothetical protein